MEKFWGENVHPTPPSIMPFELSQPRVMILGGAVAVCLLLSVHLAVIFAIAQLFCLILCICIATSYLLMIFADNTTALLSFN